MANFAKVLNGKVINVIVAEPEYFESFVDSIPGQWVQTSYNTRGGIHYQANSNTPSEDQSLALRKNYAGIGYDYDAEADAFIPPQVFPSWVLNQETYLWQAPVAMPTDGQTYTWNESTTSWDLVPEQE